VITKRELAIELRVCPRTIDNLIRERRIPVMRIKSRLVRFDLERVQQALSKFEIAEIGRSVR
jgi:excisionase family DNA binding protein